jgi:tetratricopeptide (TPR) repeat protein
MERVIDARGMRLASAALLILALSGLAATTPAGRAGAQEEPPPLDAGPSQAEPVPPAPPSSNEDAKTGREPGAEGASPHGNSRADLSLEDLHLEQPGQRAKVLERLYDELGRAKDATDAAPVAEVIEQVWNSSGSPTIDLLMSRARTFISDSALDLASQVLDDVVELAPDDAEGWHQRAMVHFLQEDYIQARSDLKRALQLDPQHYKALYGLGNVLLELGDKKGALEAFRKALKVNPFLDSAREKVDELKREVEGQDI